MNEQFEMVGVMGTETFPKYNVVSNAADNQWHKQLDERVVPVLFKDLPAGVEIYIKVKNEN